VEGNIHTNNFIFPSMCEREEESVAIITKFCKGKKLACNTSMWINSYRIGSHIAIVRRILSW
jgi:hypothetical protein